MCIGAFLNDYPENLYLLEELIESKRGCNYFDDIESEIWSIARESEKVPHIGNIYTYLVYSSLNNIIEEDYTHLNLDVEIHINSICSSFAINGEEIKDSDDFERVVEELEMVENVEV